MPSKVSKLLTLSLLISASLFAGCNQEKSRISMHEPSSDCSRIASLVPRLRSQSDSMRERAKEDILLVSSKSMSSRQCAIQRLLDIAAMPTTRDGEARSLFWTTPGLYSQW